MRKKYNHFINMTISVALEQHLLTPIIRHHHRSLDQLSHMHTPLFCNTINCF